MALFEESTNDKNKQEFTKLKDFFGNEAQKNGISKEFQAVADALVLYEKAYSQVVSEQSAKELVFANQALLSACETYAETRKGAWTSSGKNRLNAVQRLMDFQKQQNLDEIRDLRLVHGIMEEDKKNHEKNPKHTNRTWEQVGAIPMQEITLTGNEKSVGDKVNIRLQVEHDGKKGFFTNKKELKTGAQCLDSMMENLDENITPDKKKMLEDNLDLLKDIFNIETFPDNIPQEEKLQRVRGNINMRRNQFKEKSKVYKDLTQLMEDRDVLSAISGSVEEYTPIQTAMNTGSLKVGEGSELTSRNVATSRMAELLGMGDIIAHSRKMVVHNNGKTMEGCFMEFAKGDDILSKDRAVQEKFRQVENVASPEFNRVSSTLEIFDLICAQKDRHTKNMFYQFSEPDEKGKRTITGLMGIDNDLAFSTLVDEELMAANLPFYDTMTFIDEGLADKITNIKRSDLDFAVGDILSKEEIDALEYRVKGFQERLKEGKMVKLNPDEWALDKYKLSDYKDCKQINLSKSGVDERYVFDFTGKNLSQREMSYANGLLEREHALKRTYSGGRKFQKVEKEIQTFIKIWNKELAEEAKKEQPVREKIGKAGLEKPIAKETTVEKKEPAKTTEKETTEKKNEAKTEEKQATEKTTEKIAEKTVEKTAPVRQKVDIRIGEHRAGKQIPAQTKKKQAPPLPKRPERKNEQTANKDQKQSENKVAMGKH